MPAGSIAGQSSSSDNPDLAWRKSQGGCLMKTTAFRRLKFALFILIFVLGLTPVSPAVIGKAGNEFIYYSYATFTHPVGIPLFCKHRHNFRSGQIPPFANIPPSRC